MDDGFSMLDEFHDDQALERQLESLLDDASDHLPDLDGGVLGEGTHASSSVDGLDVLGQDIFDNPQPPHATPSYNLPSPGGPMLTQHNINHPFRSSSVHSVHSPPHSHHASPANHSIPPSPHQMQSPASIPPSPAQHQFSVPSPAQPPSPATYLPMKSPVNLPPPQSPANIYYSKSPAALAPPQSPQSVRISSTPGPPVLSPQPVNTSQNSIFLAAPSPTGSVITGTSLLPGTVLSGNQLGMQPLQLHPNGTIVSGGQVYQIQLQPNVSMHGMVTSSSISLTQAQPSLSFSHGKGKQPQLLPKPTTNVSQQSGTGRVSAQGVSQPTQPTLGTVSSSAPQLFINQNGVISNMQPAHTPIIMGQMMAQAGHAGTPMIIQQPSGGPMFVLRPNNPTLQASPTIVPIAAAQTGLAGQFFLQQGQQRGILGNQQVKLIQNQVQMQQIQTSSGPKLIAVPFGQTLLQGQNLIATPSSGGMQMAGLNSSGQIQFQAAPNITFSTASIMPNSSQGFTLQPPTSSQQSSIGNNLGMKTTQIFQQTSAGQFTPMISSHENLNLGGTAIFAPGQSVIQQNTQHRPGPDPPAMSPPKKKKSKKKKRDFDDEPPQQMKSGTVDLGALMKDVGLDLDDLDSWDQNQDSSSNIDIGYQGSGVQCLNTSQESTSSSETESNTQHISQADILQGHGAQLSLPQFTSHVSQPMTYTTQVSSQSQPVLQTLSQGARMSTTQIVTPQGMSSQLVPSQVLNSVPQMMTPQLSAGSSFQLIQGPDGQFILQSSATPAQPTLTPEPNLPPPTPEPQPPAAVTPPRASPRSVVRTRQPMDPNRTPLMEDETLPPGWHRKVSQRKSGASAGRYEVFIIGPSGKRFRSRNELKSFFEKTGESTLNPDDFDFSTFGRNNPKSGGSSSGIIPSSNPSFPQRSSTLINQSSTTTSTILQPPLNTSSIQHFSSHSSVSLSSSSSTAPSSLNTVFNTSSINSSSSLHPSSSSSVYSSTQSNIQGILGSQIPQVRTTQSQLNPLSETELIKKLEVTGMASVAAARALETGVQSLSSRNNLLQCIQQPLPQSALVSPPVLEMSRDPTRAPGSLDIHKPPPSLDLSSLSIPPSPLQDADEQISKLLKTLHQQPGIKSEEEKMEDIFNSLSSRRPIPQTRPHGVKSPEPPVITSMKSSVKNSGVFNENIPSPSMPILLPQVPISESAKVQEGGLFQNSYLENLAKTQIGDKRGRSRSSSGTVNILSPGRMPPLLSPTSGQKEHSLNQMKSSSVIQQTPRFDSSPAQGGPPNVTIQTTIPAPAGMSMGGAGSQIRAMQHAPPNTRLVRGPNGQVTLQKFQTIELSPGMQNTFKMVAQRISDIEAKIVKTPQDEAELASLQAKQHQILSTGRPVSNQPVSQPSIPQPSPYRAHLTQPKPNFLLRPNPPLNQTQPGSGSNGPNPNFIQGVHQDSRIIPQIPVNKLAQNIPAQGLMEGSAPSLVLSNPGFHPSSLPPQLKPSQPQPSIIPPLTEVQKKIVAEFKSKISNLPPDQQQAFIAQNKSNLIRKLNFQPSQIHTLQGGRPQLNQPLLPPIQIEQPRPPMMLLRPPMVPQTILPTLRPPSTVVPELHGLNPPEFGVIRQPTLPPVITKAKKIAWVESQIKKDQQEAVNPNFKTPFRSKEDACKRLLRYHVFDSPNMTLEDWNQSEDEFENKSISLLGKYHSMLSKYHILLLQESTRLCSSSEEVMLARHWEADERASLKKEKEEYARVVSRINELQLIPNLEGDQVDELENLLEKAEPAFPPIPSSWESRYEQVVGKPYESSSFSGKEHIKHKVFSKKQDRVSTQRLTPLPLADIKKEPDLSEMPVLEDERLFRFTDSKLSFRSRNSSQASLDSFRSRNDSGASKKELRVNLTNLMSFPNLKKELTETGSILSSSSRPQSTDLSSPEHGGSFVGLKFNRTTTGRWSASLKRELEENEDNDGGDYLSGGEWKKSRFSPRFGSDSDDDFTLADVGGEAAVRSMLEEEDEDEDDEEEDGEGMRFFSHGNLFESNPRGTPGSEGADNDSVQNAINSILDLHDRGGIETPDDLNNLTGLLDSIEDEDPADPNLDAAVKSIQGLL